MRQPFIERCRGCDAILRKSEGPGPRRVVLGECGRCARKRSERPPRKLRLSYPHDDLAIYCQVQLPCCGNYQTMAGAPNLTPHGTEKWEDVVCPDCSEVYEVEITVGESA